MARHYHIGESGNAGELGQAGLCLAFGDQPIFGLAAVASDDDPLLADDVVQHGVALSVLKASLLDGGRQVTRRHFKSKRVIYDNSRIPTSLAVPI